MKNIPLSYLEQEFILDQEQCSKLHNDIYKNVLEYTKNNMHNSIRILCKHYGIPIDDSTSNELEHIINETSIKITEKIQIYDYATDIYYMNNFNNQMKKYK